MSSIIFCNGDEYIISVQFEEEEEHELAEIAKFEGNRISSLKARDIPIVSERRIWDGLRKISVRYED